MTVNLFRVIENINDILTFWSCSVMRLKSLLLRAILGGLAISSGGVATQTFDKTSCFEVEAIDRVWSGHRVAFDYVGKGDQQIVAYYDASRQMSVAYKPYPTGNWIYQKLDSYLGWDSHNSVVIGLDEEGYIHIVGNLHVNPIVYFKSEKPYDVRSLKRVDFMADEKTESRMTYPEFFNDAEGKLYFKYRNGRSGSGNEIYNAFNAKDGTWQRLHDSPLVDGEGERNGYFWGPVLGPDGYFHLSWVWRETPVAASNHDISYAKSKDLVNWQKSDGTSLTLPMKLSNSEAAVPLPQFSGILNGHTPIGFDHKKRPLISYQAYDENGDSQLFVARNDNGKWKSYQVSNWRNSRQELNMTGALPTTLTVKQPAKLIDNGDVQVFADLDGTAYAYTLDGDSLTVKAETTGSQIPPALLTFDKANDMPLYTKAMKQLETDDNFPTAGKRFYLAWEALPPNRDKGRAFIPEPTTLTAHCLK
ncbi:BNR repeat-containing protein [Alteromonas sp. BMJM2]|uniref:BNR repeat-containing protein n=1 Tax=Alteromonas sp. BMJM2 TaxID=2954241 RepID=UPI0022B334CA|nr:BNR repeat-containing protein [Alteromonas sp. BMJM2]